MTWCRQATSHYLDQCLAKFVCHYLEANELIYSQTVAEPTDFSLVVCMASNLIFRKQRYSGRRRSYIYPTWKCRIAISSTLVRGLCRQGYSFALATPGGACLAAVFCWSCRETVCYCTRLAGHLATVAASATHGSQWHKTRAPRALTREALLFIWACAKVVSIRVCQKIILNVTISKLLVLVSLSGLWFGVYVNNISALV